MGRKWERPSVGGHGESLDHGGLRRPGPDWGNSYIRSELFNRGN
jgi:hypothetical protein